MLNRAVFAASEMTMSGSLNRLYTPTVICATTFFTSSSGATGYFPSANEAKSMMMSTATMPSFTPTGILLSSASCASRYSSLKSGVVMLFVLFCSVSEIP